MHTEKVERNHVVCAVVHGSAPVIQDAQSALDLLMHAKYELGTKNIVTNFIGPVIGAHSGPGTVALFFVGEKR